MGSRVLWQGSEAVVEAAIRVGCNFFVGYPITPASEILELSAARAPRHGGVFVQAEDEIAAINMAIGASWAGRKPLIATSGPGFSLMQEGIGYAVMTETPLVLVDAMRTGPATGQATKTAQGDLLQAVWGRHGDQAVIVLIPDSVEDLFRLTVRSFNLAEKYRVPVILTVEEAIVHLRESVDTSKLKVEVVERKKPRSKDEPPFGGDLVPPMPEVGEGYNLLVTGSTHDEYGVRKTSDPEVHRRLVERLVRKIHENRGDIVEYEARWVEDAEYLVVAVGIVGRAASLAVRRLRERGVRAGLFKPKTLWPFPCEELERIVRSGGVERILVPEMNLKQLYYMVRASISGAVEVHPYNKIGGGILIYPGEIEREVLRWR